MPFNFPPRGTVLGFFYCTLIFYISEKCQLPFNIASIGDIDIGYVMYLTNDSSCFTDTLNILKEYPNIIAFIGPRTSFMVLSLASLLSNLR